MAGEIAAPKAAETLGIVFKHIDADEGVVEVEMQGRPELTNPAGNIQGGFLASMLDDTNGSSTRRNT
jgi:acyl-coenzyme A thioesterase PaaI-like protein